MHNRFTFLGVVLESIKLESLVRTYASIHRYKKRDGNALVESSILFIRVFVFRFIPRIFFSTIIVELLINFCKAAGVENIFSSIKVVGTFQQVIW